jgi:uncharacterized membrane protein YfcA
MDISPFGAPLSLVALTIFTFLLAGLVKGTIGLGLPSIAIGLRALAMTPAQAAAVMIFPSLITNVWQMFIGVHLAALMRRLWTLVLASAAGIWLGGGVLTSANSRFAALGLGVALIVYAALGLSNIRFTVEPRQRSRHEWWLNPIVGLLTGLIAGGTGVFVIPAGPYFQAIGLTKDELVQMLGLSFTVSTITLGVVLWRNGALHVANACGSMLAVLPALAGMAIGQRTVASPAKRHSAGGSFSGCWCSVRSRQCATCSNYSITPSARATTDRGIVKPSALAVLRLTTSSRVVGCSTGRSAGLAPLRILSTK